MTIASVILGLVARINYLKIIHDFPKEVDDIVISLENIKSIADGTQIEVENEVRRVSLSIYKVMEEATKLSPKAKVTVKKLQDLNKNLNHLYHVLNSPSKGKRASSSSRISSSPAPKFVEPFYKIRTTLSVSDTVYIVGKSGMGKSTMARQLFDYLQAESSDFEICAWIRVKRIYNSRRMLKTLLRKLNPGGNYMDTRCFSRTQIVAKILKATNNKKVLLVLDDVGDLSTWECICPMFAFEESSKLIVTSDSMDLTQIDPSFVLQGMSEDEIITILSDEEPSFGIGSMEVAKAIFDISGGSPLLASILGKSLKSELATVRQQELLHELHSYQSQRGTPHVLEPCYRRLSPVLQTFYLYLAQFPFEQDIDVEKLYMHLAAEHSIPPSNAPTSFFQPITDLLEQLSSLKLIEVRENMSSTRGIKMSYRLQSQVFEFCRLKGFKENFMEVIDICDQPRIMGMYAYRVVINLSDSRCYKHSSSWDFLNNITAMIIHDTAKENSEWPPEVKALKEFHSLAILDFDGVNFSVRRFPRGMDRLVLLCHLSFRGCWLEVLPSSIKRLIYLETLDLSVEETCTMLISADTFEEMNLLLHLYLPSLFQIIQGTKLELYNLNKLQILINFNPVACNVEALYELHDLRIFSIVSNGDPHAIMDFINGRGDILEHSSANISGFVCDSSAKVSAVESVLDCRFLNSISIEGHLGWLPQRSFLTKNIEHMVLNGSFITGALMYLGTLVKLETLVLSDAFADDNISLVTDDVFLRLKILKLEKSDQVKSLVIAGFPILQTLIIDNFSAMRKLSISQAVDMSLKKAQEYDNDHTYSITPFPPEFEIFDER